MVQKFRFDIQQYKNDATIPDQNVYQYQFIVLGSTAVTINQNMTLRVGSPLASWLEPIKAGEKSAQVYKIRFQNSNDPNNLVIVISKIPVA